MKSFQQNREARFAKSYAQAQSDGENKNAALHPTLERHLTKTPRWRMTLTGIKFRNKFQAEDGLRNRSYLSLVDRIKFTDLFSKHLRNLYNS